MSLLSLKKVNENAKLLPKLKEFNDTYVITYENGLYK